MFIKDSVYSQRSVTEVKSPVACFHPNLVFNPYLDDYVVVPCRTCAACRASYARDLQNRIEEECKSHLCNVFFTLTYDNLHMPMYYAFPSADGVYFKAFRGNKPLLDAHGEELPELDFDLKDSWYAEPQHNPYQTGFGFCLKSDIQKFIKRLRIKISRKYGNAPKFKIRYFIASEYGPVTFRPHYHGIFGCDDERLARDLPRLIRETWTLCNPERCDVQYVCGAASAYVAKYVNGFARLPQVLTTQLTRPFHLASKNPALGSFKINEKDLFDCFVNNNFERPSVDSETGEVTFTLFPNKVLSRYFRKYCGYGEGNLDYELRLYKKYATGNYRKVYDSENHRYVECHLRGEEYLKQDGSFKYKDYLWYKCVRRLLHSSFSFPKRNECGYVVGMHENVTFTLTDILRNMRNMYCNYSLYLLNSYYRSQEVLSTEKVSPFEKLSFYPYVWKLLPAVCSKLEFRSTKFYKGLSLAAVFKQLRIKYEDVYDDGFLMLDVYDMILNAPFVKRNQDKLLTQIQQSDYKKKFNDLYNF